VDRSTFVIDEEGVIRAAMRGVKAKEHAGQVLEALEA
jgi:thioredoxin-dependent peroxiredoxin